MLKTGFESRLSGSG